MHKEKYKKKSKPEIYFLLSIPQLTEEQNKEQFYFVCLIVIHVPLIKDTKDRKHYRSNAEYEGTAAGEVVDDFRYSSDENDRAHHTMTGHVGCGAKLTTASGCRW